MTSRIASIASLFVLATAAQADAPGIAVHDIQLVERVLYGPGPMPDQKLARGHVHNMQFDRFMHAVVPGANNGGESPNVTGEALQGSPVDGKLSDGTLINENIDMGNALLLQGRFNLLLGAVHGGPHQGNSTFALDRDLNWTIEDDIAIDPGFAEGIIKINDFKFTTGPAFVPTSVQTQKNYPGGVDMVGSLRSRDVLVGRVGDDDFDGFVDGIFLALGNFPLDSILLPGAPFVQTIQVASDYPLHALDAAMLSLAAARNHLNFLHQHRAEPLSKDSMNLLRKAARERHDFALRHLRRALEKDSGCADGCKQVRKLEAQMAELGIERAEPEQLAVEIRTLDAAVAQLAALHKSRTGKEVF
jgi:hypothetical protein